LPPRSRKPPGRPRADRVGFTPALMDFINVFH
jgi:hypothetical protein